MGSPLPSLQKEYSPGTLHQSQQDVKGNRKGSMQACRMQRLKKKTDRIVGLTFFDMVLSGCPK